MILEKSQDIQPASILIEPPADRGAGSLPDGAASPEDFSLETAEREFILRALKETGWQRTRAAGLLGITRATLHSKLKKYNISPPDTLGGTAATTEEVNDEETFQEACA